MKQLVRFLVCITVIPLLLVLAASAQSALTAAGSVDTTPSGAPATDQPFVDWTKKHAIPLKTVEAKHGFEDMQPLKTVVGNARIVALGEATHGTREFFQLKHRMVEFLASQKGFTIFSIEANMPEAYRLNDFVLNGNGDPKELLKGMYFWTWNTEEVLQMILWMREFNQSGKGHIEFTGFDMQTPTVSMDIVRSFIERSDPTYLDAASWTYQDVARLSRAGSRGQAFGVATATFPVNAAAGKHVKYSGFIRTENITQGYAGLWWRADGDPGQVLAFDNLQSRGAKGTTPWTRYEISLDTPPNAKNINFGVLHPGDGTAWFDSLQVEIDGKPYADVGLFDLDFEASSARGFYTGGAGYEVTLDPEVAHSGHQSLRSKLVSPHPVPSQEDKAVDNKELAERCKKILEHLESGRARFLEKANAKNVDWVIQNARLVLQYMQLKTGDKSRDQSMAENVKWIADHAPEAKIILWAHNGHVAYKVGPTLDPMGGYLRKMFGSQLVNFGFAFDEGSFRAVEMGKGLREFTVPPAPEGSLDRTLAATGMPVFALDLRQMPTDGAVAQWISQSHLSRSIGAVYNEANAPSFFHDLPAQAFDVILFVDRTTAARGNH